jgi:hypothetical protein
MRMVVRWISLVVALLASALFSVMTGTHVRFRRTGFGISIMPFGRSFFPRTSLRFSTLVEGVNSFETKRKTAGSSFVKTALLSPQVRVGQLSMSC